MHRFGRTISLATAVLVAGTLSSCATDRVSSPVQSASDSPVSVQLTNDIAIIRSVLANNDFGVDRGDTVTIGQRRTQVQGLLTSLESQLQNLPLQNPPQQGSLRFDEAPAPPPPCLLNGNLNGCFLAAYHRIAIDGTGTVVQLTSLFASQSAVVGITLDGSAQQPISVGGVGFSLPGWALSQPFSWTPPDCNASAHTVASTVTHQLSLGLPGIGSVSGVTTSVNGTSCAYKGLTVSVSPSTIYTNDVASVTISGFTECSMPGLTSSNTNVATIVSGYAGAFQAQSAGAGTTTLTAACGTQRGSASLTVKEPDWCTDESADNYGGALPCTFAPPPCEDPTASNYEQAGTCTYPPPPPATCNDGSADNYGGALPCTYQPPPPQCEDPTAENYSQFGDCIYPPPPPPDDPGTGDGGSGGSGGVGGGGGDDPCFYNPADESCFGNLMFNRLPGSPLTLGGSSAATFASTGRQQLSAVPAGQAPYYFELADKWSDASVIAIVGRFLHNGAYVDAIYLPAGNATATAWTLAVRALQADRAGAADPNAVRRVIQIRADGSQQLVRNDGAPKTLPSWTPLSTLATAKIDAQFKKGVMKAVKRAAKKKSSGMGGVQMIKWPHK